MAIARHAPGARSAIAALASQVHPVFMLPPIASSWLGAALAESVTIWLGTIHATAAFFALYTAHVTDGYVDFYVRGEDDDHPLSERGCRIALLGASLGFVCCLAAIGWAVGLVAALLTLPGWLIAASHAPQLDTNPIGATAGYPTGIGFALVGGYYVQSETLTLPVVALAVIFVTILSGIKVIDDATDYAYDRSIDKRTVAVVLGRERAWTVAYGLMAAGALAVFAVAISLSWFPPSAAVAAVVFGVVAWLARRADPEIATMLLIRGSYLFLAALVAAVWFEPLG